MNLEHIILGPIISEKAERFRTSNRTYTLRVAPGATKVDVRRALERFYDVEISSIRMMRVGRKVRAFGKGGLLEKRHRVKKALITLTPKSKVLDLAAFQR